MLEVARALNELLDDGRIAGVALVGGDHSVLKAGLAVPDEALVQVGVRARQVFRLASPTLRRFDLRFQTGRAVILPMRGAVLFVQTDAEATLAEIEAAVGECRARFERFADATRTIGAPETSSPVALVPSSTPPPAASSPELLAVAVAVFRLAIRKLLLAELGGPVIRNYLRKSRDTLEPRYAFTEGFRIGLDGNVEPPVALPDDPALVIAGLGRWLGLSFARARQLLPSLDVTAVRRLAGAHAQMLDDHGFFTALEQDQD